MMYVLYLFLGYLLFRFIFGFLIPVVRTTRQVRKSFRQMQQQMEQMQRQQTNPQPEKPANSTRIQSDYIDFEEIKD